MIYETIIGSKQMSMEVSVRIHFELPRLEWILVVETDDFNKGVPRGAFSRNDFPCCNDKGLCTNSFTFLDKESMVNKMKFLKNKFVTYYEFQKDFATFVKELENLNI